MAWYITRTAASMPPGARALSSRHWLGPFATEAAARAEYHRIKADGVGLKDLLVEEDPSVSPRSATTEP